MRPARLVRRPRQLRRDRFDLLHLLRQRLSDGSRGLSGLLGQRLHAVLHFLAQAVEIGRSLLRRLVHAARGGVELAAHLLQLTPDLGDDCSKVPLRSVTARAVWAWASSRSRSIWATAACAWPAVSRASAEPACLALVSACTMAFSTMPA